MGTTETPRHLEDITRCLRELEGGDRSAVGRAFPYVYEELRALASAIFHRHPGNQTLQPTVLVHEAYMRLAKAGGEGWVDRQHFYNVAAMAMRQLLTDHARGKHAAKRGGRCQRVELDQRSRLGGPDEGLDLVALDDALSRLAELDPRQARIVELRFLAGLTVEETAQALGISESTVYVDWQMARNWLSRELA
jgi:RNA polymerase sigma-70 factor, ECF subfamily